MTTIYTYSSISPNWSTYASKGDCVQFPSQGQAFKGIVESVNKDGIIVTIHNANKQIDVKHGSYNVIERKYSNTKAIPIEVMDLVTFSIDGTNYTAVIAGIDGTNVIVDIISNPKMGRQQTLVNKISFVTKGFIVSPTPAMQQVGISPAATVNNPNMPMNTAQNPAQIALLYPAPCVVMAVPYKTNPDSFPEAMYVQMPDRAPGQPVLLPVVRMGCDTALVVIPPSKGKGQTTVGITPVKSQGARPN